MAIAQLDEEESKAFPFGIGPYITLKGGVNTVDPVQGIKNGFTINPLPDFGATFYIPFSKTDNIGVNADLFYGTYAYQFRVYGNETVNWIEQFHYIALGANVNFNGLILGLNLGIPVGGYVDNPALPDNSKDVRTENLGFLAEGHIGGQIPLFKNALGRLCLYVQLGYNFSGIYTNLTEAQDKYNPQPASAQLGFSYIFNLVDEEE